MQRLPAIDPAVATGKAKTLLDGVQAKLGLMPNITRTMSNSPAVLDAYLGFSGGLAKGALPAKLREQIALVVAEANGCGYCLAVHTAIGKAQGLTDSEMLDSRRGGAEDLKTAAALGFAGKVVRERARVTDQDVAALRHVGYGDGEIAEIVANVALNVFTNYFNHVAGTEVDFPAVPALSAGASCSCG
ncbi:MAG: carboxymuconolactone decarboxylase family protein [Nitrospirota bacterium]